MAVFVEDVPDGGAGEVEAAAGGRDADALVVVDVALAVGRFEHAGAFVAVQGFSGETRRGLQELFERQLPQLESDRIGRIQDRVGLGAVRDDDERGLEDAASLLFRSARAVDELAADPALVRVEQTLNLALPVEVEPGGEGVHRM